MKKILTLLSTFSIVSAPTLAFVVSCGTSDEETNEDSIGALLQLIENYKTDISTIIENFVKTKIDNLFISVGSTTESKNKFLQRDALTMIVSANGNNKITKYSQLNTTQQANLRNDFENLISFSSLSSTLNSQINKNKYNSIVQGISDVLPSYSIDENNFKINYVTSGNVSIGFSSYVKMNFNFNIKYINANKIQETYEYSKKFTFNISSGEAVLGNVKNFTKQIDTFLLKEYDTSSFQYGWLDQTMITDSKNGLSYSDITNKGKILKPNYNSIKNLFTPNKFKTEINEQLQNKFFQGLPNLENIFQNTQVVENSTSIEGYLKNASISLVNAIKPEGVKLYNLIFSKNSDFSTLDDNTKNILKLNLGLEFENYKKIYDAKFINFLDSLEEKSTSNDIGDKDFRNKLDIAKSEIATEGYKTLDPFTQQILRSAGYIKISFDKIEIKLTSEYIIPIEDFSTYVSITSNNNDNVLSMLEKSNNYTIIQIYS
ncbi:hypothetical protein [Spiroplasma taiwanense]|uniref:Lipoprotein n=1 Tax=Spiroplasma taiwanense CT-1 TaxID=1276220 RepID=S5LZL9_9MOLU|nr:hypothetical protein [Spiroplasma taiwanense]AGR41157.1 hypothetical protein STAIW_v1c05300 [Spiroplasma taiwanense CT-1]